VLRGGIDDWAGQRAAFVGGALEHRLLRNRVSILADINNWFGGGSLPRFTATSVRARWSSSPVAYGWSAAVGGGIQRVSNGAPLALWSGAGDGRERGELLRAHPMLDDGVINVTPNSVFGRSIAFGNVETRHWMDTPWPVRFGVAAFVDVAHAGVRAFAAPTTQVDVGGGLRLRLPGSSRTLRVDVAHGLRDGANALTIGWTY